MTIHFHSPKAYDFLRKHFCLPHPNTLREWANKINGQPGFTAESFAYIKHQVEKSDYPVFVALSLDEMSIMKHTEWTGKEFSGYVNLGLGTDAKDTDVVATSALVLMATAVNGHWKVPLGYFFVHGTPGWLLKNLVSECLFKIKNTGAKCIALVCDGLRSNITMANSLGVVITEELIHCNFPNPGKLLLTNDYKSNAARVFIMNKTYKNVKKF